MKYDFDSILQEIRKKSKNTKELGDKFEKLSFDFFKTDKVYANRFSNVWTWATYPERDGPDTGIDLVAHEKDGTRCAIQCKCYADDGSIDLKKVSTFIAKALADGYENKILVYTGEKLTSHASVLLKKAHVSILKQVDFHFSSIDWSKWPKLLVKKPKILHDYQEIALDKTLDGLANNDRGKLIMACGTGKTLVSLHVAEKIVEKGGIMLYLVPSISLITQSMRAWSENAKIPHYYLAVCSDKSTKSSEEEGTITELECPVSTNDEILSPYLKKRPKDAMTVIFSTYHSVEVVKKAIKNEKLDLIVFDEAHRTTGIEDKSFFTFAHQNKNIFSKKRLYMTATPKIYSDVIKAKVGKVIYSMDDEKKFGPEFHRLTFTEAVQKYNALSDFKVKIAIVDADTVDKDFQMSVSDENLSMPLDDKTMLAAVWHGLQFPDDDESKPHLLQKVIAFSNRIDRSKMFAGHDDDKNKIYPSRSLKTVVNEYNSIKPTKNKVEVRHIDGKDNAEYRRRELIWLGKSDNDKTSCRILSNARCLSEGIDVPELDGIVFLNPRKSVVDVVQSVGRVMRKAQRKEYGYIILPVAIPAGINPNDALDQNDPYKVVWQVLNALRSHDEKFAREINSLILDREPGKKSGAITKRVSVSIFGNKDDRITKDKFYDKIKTKLLQKIGEYDYYDKYGAKLGSASTTVEMRIRNKLDADNTLNAELQTFLQLLQKIINSSVTKDDAIQIISQHVILSEIFDELFSGEFTTHNPIAIVLDDVARKFGLKEEIEELEGFYEQVKKEVAQIKTREARQNFIKKIYENFFNSLDNENDDIVFTPIELVDFIINSTEYLLHKHFGLSFNDRIVKVLDPFTGTGSFITRILESNFITNNIYEKYKHDLFANEKLFLAYYIATINIETTYASLRKSGKYVPFNGTNFTDTLLIDPQYKIKNKETKEIFYDESLKKIHHQIQNQKQSHIHVLLGNPPYSVGRHSYGDKNTSIMYPNIDNHIKNTYAKKTKSTLLRSLYDSYIRSLRWASDRIGSSGIIAFVTNAGFIDSKTASGIRASFQDEFNEIWCYNLRGDGRNTGDGRNIFEYPGKSEGGTRTPVTVIILVKNKKRNGCNIWYSQIDEKYHSGADKRKRVRELNSINGIKNWEKINPDKNYDWINQKNDLFEIYTPITAKKDRLRKTNKIFDTVSPGVSTARDMWVYNFSIEALSKNMRKTIRYCNNLDLHDSTIDKQRHDPKQVKWSRDLLKRLIRVGAVFDSSVIQDSLYRPFCKQFLYYDRVFNEAPGSFVRFFPEKNSNNFVICVSDQIKKHEFSCMITDLIPDAHLMGDSSCFPLYVFESNEKKLNITDFALNEYQEFYKDKNITKKDIFYCVYGLLHHPQYRKKYANNLAKEIPHIPMAPKFWEFTKAGKSLAELHLNYETCKKYDLGKPKHKKFGQLNKLSFPKKKVNDKNVSDFTKIKINGLLAFENIPEIDYKVNGRTPLEWIVDRYKVTTHKESGITNSPGDIDITSVIQRAVFVGVESDKIIKNLPEEFEPKDWKPKKSGLEVFT